MPITTSRQETTAAARDAPLTRKTARELTQLIRSKAVSPVEVLDAYLNAIEKLNPKINAIVTLAAEQARDGGQARRSSGDEGRQARPPPRATDRRQGCDPDRRHPHHLRLATLQGLRADRGCRSGAPPQSRRRHRACQDQHAGIRRRRQHQQRAVRADPQSVEPGAEPGRLVRRLGCRRRRPHVADRAWHRFRLLDPHTRGVLRHRRHSRDAGPYAEPSAALAVGSGSGARAAGAGRRGCGALSRRQHWLLPHLADLGRAAVAERAGRTRAPRRP